MSMRPLIVQVLAALTFAIKLYVKPAVVPGASSIGNVSGIVASQYEAVALVIDAPPNA